MFAIGIYTDNRIVLTTMKEHQNIFQTLEAAEKALNELNQAKRHLKNF